MDFVFSHLNIVKSNLIRNQKRIIFSSSYKYGEKVQIESHYIFLGLGGLVRRHRVVFALVRHERPAGDLFDKGRYAFHIRGLRRRRPYGVKLKHVGRQPVERRLLPVLLQHEQWVRVFDANATRAFAKPRR